MQGPLALELWNAMLGADRLVEQLRATSTPPAAVPQPASAAPVAAPGAVVPFVPAGAPAPAPRRLPSASVPVVLLFLGALCLLVAAIVFVAVTWGILGLTGRTLVLLGVTTLLAAGAVLLTRKSLRGAAETFWLVVAGMLTVDLLAAESAGLLGLDTLPWRGVGALVGGALLVLGTAVGAWARTQPVTRLLGMEAVGVVGGLVLCVTNGWLAQDPAVGTTVAIVLLAGAFVLLRRPVPVTAYGLGLLSLVSWLVLLGMGLDRAAETAGLAEWWSELRGWPLVVAFLLAGALAHAPGVPTRARPVAAGLALAPLVALANAPWTVGTPTRDVLVECATLLALAAVTALAPLVWARGAAALTALGVLLLGARLLIAPWSVLADLTTDGSTPLDATMTGPDGGPVAGTAGVVALTLVVALATLLRHVPAAGRREASLGLGALAPAGLVLGGLVVVLQLEPPLWAGVLAAATAAVIAGAAAWWARDHLLAGVLGTLSTAYLTLLALFAASASELLIALTTTVTFVVAGVVCALRDRVVAPVSAAVAGGAATLLGGWVLVTWGVVMDADTEAQALAVATYAGLVGVLAAALSRRPSTRVTFEGAAALLAVIAVGTAGDRPATAMALTIVGSALCIMAVTNRDREVLGWGGAVVLGAATVLRVDAGVTAPELYVLPAAAVLVAVGAWRLRHDPQVGSFSTLGSGLVLGLVPSLLLALDEPVSLRGALVGAAGLVVLAAGIGLRLAAPFVVGAVTTALLALRHLEPVAEAVPRWISLGAVGLLLLLVGVTWEARRRNLATARHYLTALR